MKRFLYSATVIMMMINAPFMRTGSVASVMLCMSYVLATSQNDR